MYSTLTLSEGLVNGVASLTKRSRGCNIFFSPFGPRAHLHPKLREDPTVNTRENMRPSFALYKYDSKQLQPMIMH